MPYEKIGKNEPVCIADEVPFDIPESWEWVRLGTILHKLSDGTHSKPHYVASGIPFISVKDISGGKLDFSDCKYITKEEHRELYSRCNPEYGDILLTKVGTTGIPVIVDTNSSNKIGIKLSYITTSNLYWDRFELDKLKEMLFGENEIEKCTVTRHHHNHRHNCHHQILRPIHPRNHPDRRNHIHRTDHILKKRVCETFSVN